MAQNIGSAYLEFMPTLAASAMSKLSAEASKVGATAGKSLGDTMTKSAETSTNKMGEIGTKAGKALGDNLAKSAKASGNLNGLAQEANRALASIKDKTINVDADANKVKASVSTVNTLIGTIKDKAVDIVVNNDKVKASVATVNTLVSGIKDKTINAVMDNAKVKQSVASVNSLLGTIKEKIKVDIEVDTRGAREKLRDLADDMNNTEQEGRLLRGAMAALGPALVPAMAVGVGAVAGLGAAIGAAALPLGIFGAAVGTVFGEFKKQQEKIDTLKGKLANLDAEIERYKALGKDTAVLDKQKAKLLEKMNAEYAKLPEGSRAAFDAFENLKGSWQDFIKANGAQVYGTMQRVFDTLTAGIGKLQPLMDIGAKAGEALSKKFENFVNGGGLDKFVQFISKNAPSAINNLGGILKNLGTFLVNVFKNFMPTGQGFLKWLNEATAKLANWSAGDGLTKFVQYMSGNGGKVASILADIAKAAVNISQAVAPLAPISLAVAQALAKIIAAVPQPVITALVASFVAYRTAVAATTAVAKTAAVASGLWAGVQGKNTAANSTNTASIVANRVALVAHAAASKVATVASAALNAVMRANPFAIIVTAIAALVAGIILLYKNNETARKIIDGAWKAIKTAMVAVADWFVKTAWPALKTAFEAMGKAVEWLWKNAIQPAWNGIKTAVDVAWKAIKVIIDAFTTAYKGLETAANFLWKNVIQPVWNGIKTVIEVAWTAIKVIFAVWLTQYVLIGKAAEFLWKNVIVPVWNGIKEAISAAWNFIKTNVLDAWQTYIKGPFTSAWNAFKTFFETLWNGLKTFLTNTWNSIKTTVFDAWQTYIKGPFTTMWNVFKAAFELLWNTLKTFLTNTWNTIRTTIFDAWQTYIKGPFTAMWNAFKTFFTTLWTTLKTFLTTTWTAIKTTVFDAWQTYIKGPFMTMWNNFKTGFTVLWTAIKTMLTTIWNAIKTTVFDAWQNYIKGPFTAMWNAFKSFLTTLWNGIKSMMQAAWNWINSNVFTPIKNGINDLKTKFQLWKTAIGIVWDQWKNHIKSGWDWVKTNVFTPMQTFITKTIPDAFTTGVNAVKTAWDKIQEIVKVPVRFVANTVLRDGLFKAYNSIAGKVNAPQITWGGVSFATGGVLPGYTPGRDVHQFVSPTGGRLNLSGGEAVMRPEFTRVIGKSGVDTLNAAARSGGVAGVKSALGLARGGIVSGPHGGPSKDRSVMSTMWEGITGLGSKVLNPISGVVNGLLGKIPASGELLNLLKNAVKTLVGQAGKFITSFWGGGDGASSAGGGATPGEGGSPGGWASMWGWVKKNFPSAQLFSGYRNSFTLSGNKSLHASGRAIDITPNRAISDKIISTFGKNITELISPWPSDHYRNGQKHNYSHAIDAQHGVYGNNAHIHWAMKNGGIFDNGGILKPGKFAVNAGRKPEAVLNPAESEGLKAMGLDTLADKLDEVVEAIDRVAPGVGAHIRGSGRGLIAGGRSV